MASGEVARSVHRGRRESGRDGAIVRRGIRRRFLPRPFAHCVALVLATAATAAIGQALSPPPTVESAGPGNAEHAAPVSRDEASSPAPTALRLAQTREESRVPETSRTLTVDPRIIERLELAQTEVPALGGLTVAEAWQAVEKARLKPGQVQRVEGETDRERVVRQSPGAGSRVPTGTPVNLYVQVPSGLRVPTVIGMPETRAWATIEEAGLRRGQRIERPAPAPAGTVVEQKPGPGERVRPGTPVDLLIALPQGIAMPRLIGRQEREAWAIVEKLGLLPAGSERLASEEPPGTVLRQSPGEGRTVEPGTPVRLWVAERRLVEVPDLLRRTERDAWAMVEKSRLAPGGANPLPADAPPGTVVRQEPLPGVKVEPGMPVRIWLAETPLTKVPRLLGLTADAAVASLREARLVPGAVAEIEADDRPGTVVRQAPPAGEAVALGTAVDIWLAARPPPTLPDLRGMTEDEARRALGEPRVLALRLEIVGREPAEARPETVVRQQPSPGTRADRGMTVRVWLAEPVRVTVPDLGGLGAREAATLLEQRDLALAIQNEAAAEAGGTIAAQRPAPGAEVPPGTRVAVRFAEPPPPPQEPPPEEPPPEEPPPQEPPPQEPPPQEPPPQEPPPATDPTRFDWPWQTLAVVALAGLVLGAVSREVLRRLFRRATVRMRPVKDPGTARFEGGPPGLALPGLELRARADPGTQAVSPATFVEPPEHTDG